MPNEEIVEFDNNELIGKKLMTSNDVDKFIELDSVLIINAYTRSKKFSIKAV